MRDVGLAEELAQGALVIALEQWPESGIPENPGTGPMATAKLRAIDLLRKRALLVRRGHAALERAAACARGSAPPQTRRRERWLRKREARRERSLGSNTIETNFVSGRAGDGIALQAVGGQSLIMGSTSVENSGCDLNDSSSSGQPQNTWAHNRFGTKCGAATEQWDGFPPADRNTGLSEYHLDAVLATVVG